MSLKGYFPCPVCKGQYSYIDYVSNDRDLGGPTVTCGFCESSSNPGFIQTGGQLHRAWTVGSIMTTIRDRLRKFTEEEMTLEQDAKLQAQLEELFDVSHVTIGLDVAKEPDTAVRMWVGENTK